MILIYAMKGEFFMKDIQPAKLFQVIGKNIKYYRKLYDLEKGKMTQETLAELANVSVALIGNLESKKVNQGLSVFSLWKISQVLEVPIEKFFDGIEGKEKSV